MAKLTIQFEVDSTKLFDTLAAMKGDTGPLGARLAGVMMTGQIPWADELALAVYGIKVAPEC